MTESRPSDRVIDQRVRNRIMEVLLGLTDGNEEIEQWGPGEYFEGFYDWIPHRGDGGMRPNSAITAEERALLVQVSNLLDDACDATPRDVTTDALIASGWPERIRPVAQRALSVMLQRGRFDEEHEEQEPSSPKPWT